MDLLYMSLHVVVTGAYLAAPVGLVAVAFWRRERRRRAAARVEVIDRGASVPQDIAAAAEAPAPPAGGTLLPTFAAGATLGVGITLFYARVIAGSFAAIAPMQVLKAVYLAIALLVLMKLLDAAVRLAADRLLRRLGTGRRNAAAAKTGVRVLILVLVGMPWVMSAGMVYRPRVVPPQTPGSELALAYERIEFAATDGVRLAGWWIPAPSPRFPEATVVLVHGLGSGKADMLFLIDVLSAEGYHVLSFDLRAHGQSGGQLTSFGIREGRDVEGAVAWVRANKADQSVRLYGLGASMGAGAMLGARDAAGGFPFDAAAVLSGFDDLGVLGRTVARRQFAWPIGEVLGLVAMPLASAHAGADLSGFRPAEHAAAIWPVPLLVVHGEQDEVIPLARGASLYEAAFQPKRSLWVPGSHVSVLADRRVMAGVLTFFDDASRAPPGAIVQTPRAGYQHPPGRLDHPP